MTFTQNLYDIFFFEKGPEMCDKLIKHYSFCEYLDDSLEKFRIQNFIFFFENTMLKMKINRIRRLSIFVWRSRKKTIFVFFFCFLL